MYSYLTKLYCTVYINISKFVDYQLYALLNIFWRNWYVLGLVWDWSQFQSLYTRRICYTLIWYLPWDICLLSFSKKLHYEFCISISKPCSPFPWEPSCPWMRMRRFGMLKDKFKKALPCSYLLSFLEMNALEICLQE